MKLFTHLVAATTILMAINLIHVGAEASQELPNIVLIVSDDQGYADVGFLGSTEIPTPNIDRIALEGVIFSNGYVTHAVCGPSRAGLLTGRYQDRFGFGRNPTVNPNVPSAGLPVEEDQISELLKTVGYTNKAIGKWHMGVRDEYHPLNQGYDEFFGFLSGGHGYFPQDYVFDSIDEVDRPWGWYQTRLLNNWTRVDVDHYLTDVLSDRAVEFVSREHDGPFFLYLAYNAPHAPLQATEEYLARFPNIEDEDRRTYAAMIASMDDGIGAVLDALERRGISENTLVFFLSDNGGPEAVNASDNGPLRDGKGSLHEGGIRVPFAMRWPARIPNNQVYKAPVISLDILGTIAAVTGFETHPKRPLDGVNLLPYLLGESVSAPHKRLFWRKFDSREGAVREGDFKLTTGIVGSGRELFDLAQDISEKSNLAWIENEDARRLLEAYEAWDVEMVDPVFPGLGSWQYEVFGAEKRTSSKRENLPGEFMARGGLPNLFEKLHGGDPVRIAYLGGSITNAEGWRPMTFRWFRERFPDAELVQVNAAHSGTGSDMAAFRLERDLLRNSPDFIFVEFAVNDGSSSTERILKAMEGVVRKARRKNPRVEFCFVYTLNLDMLERYQSGQLPHTVEAMETIAGYYGIPSVFVGSEVIKLEQAGSLVFQDAVPVNDSEKETLDGRTLFSQDGTHPLEAGHRLYSEAIIRSMTKMEGMGRPVAYSLPEPLRADNFEYVSPVPVSRATLSAGWKKLDPATHPVASEFEEKLPEMWMAESPGESMTVRFKGTSLLLYDVMGPDAPKIAVTVDGGEPEIVSRFNQWSDMHHVYYLIVATDLPDTTHTVRLEILPEQPDRAAILAQRDVTIDDPERFDGTRWYVGDLLVTGEVLD